MKRIFCAALCLLLCLSLCSCKKEEPRPHDFRDVDWGMSQNDVCKAEATDYLYADDCLIYFAGEMAEHQAEIYYEFTDGKLTSAECKFAILPGMIIDDCIALHSTLREQLCEMYGEPLEAEYRVWASEEAKATYERDREALSIYNQVLQYKTDWLTDTSSMSLTLDYTDLQIKLCLHADMLETAAD